MMDRIVGVEEQLESKIRGNQTTVRENKATVDGLQMQEGLDKVVAAVASTPLEALDLLLRVQVSTLIEPLPTSATVKRHQLHQPLHQLGIWNQYGLKREGSIQTQVPH